MRFKKGDIVTAEFRVEDVAENVGRIVNTFQITDWKLVERPLDLSRPLRFANSKGIGNMPTILKAAPSSQPDILMVEYRVLNEDDHFTMLVEKTNLENIPEGESQ